MSTSRILKLSRGFKLVPLIILGALVLLLQFTPSVHAVQTVPYLINFQGRLTDSAGNTMPDGLYNIKFRLYDASSAGTLKWEEDRLYGTPDNRIQVTNSLFSVQLGSVTALTPSLFSTPNLYFEVELPTPATATCATASCASFTEGAMTPRQPLAASPYAMNAENLNGRDASTFAPASGSPNYIQNNSTSTPQTGNLNIQAASSGTTGTIGAIIRAASGGQTTDLLQLQDASGAVLSKFDSSGNLVVGTSSSIYANNYYGNGANSTLTFAANGTGNVLLQTNGANTGTIVKTATDSANALTIQNASGNLLLRADTTAGAMSINTYAGNLIVNGVANPTSPTLTSSATGGSLAAGSYYYKLAAVGTTGVYTTALAASPASIATTGTTSTNTLSWTAVANATGYIIYRSTDGSTWYGNTVAGNVTSITDNGTTYTWTTAKSPQDYNSTGQINLQQDSALVLDSGTGRSNSNIRYQSAYNSLAIGNYNAGGNIALQGDSLSFLDTTGYNKNFNLDNQGRALFKNRLDSVSAFQIQNTAGASLLTVDTSNSAIIASNVTSFCIAISSCTHTLGVSGTIAASGTITASATPDIAETIPAAPDVTAADVVMADPNNTERVVKAQTAYTGAAVGVISDGTSSFMINAHGGNNAALTGKPLVLAGRVPVKVTNEGGPIKPGDYLTTSSTPGYAMRATRAGPTIGKSLGFFDGTSGKVLILVNLSYYNPYDGNNLQAKTDSFSVLTAETASVVSLNVSGATHLRDLSVSGGSNLQGNLTVTGMTSVQSITVQGQIITSGSTPVVSPGAAAGQPVTTGELHQQPTVTVDGNDTTGTLTIRTGATATVIGTLAHIKFVQAAASNYKVVVSASDVNGSRLRVYVLKTATGFSLLTDTMPKADTEYKFDYIVMKVKPNGN